MRRTILAASALSLGLLIQQESGLGFGTALAQDRTHTTEKQGAKATEKDVTPDRASKADTGKAKPAKGEAKNKSEEQAANKAQNEGAAPKQQERPSKASTAARRGELEERNEPAARPVTELAPALKPAATTPSERETARPVTDPKLKQVPPLLNGQLKTSREAVKDRELRERVQASLLKNQALPYTARLVSVTVKDGEITLRGQLNTQHEKVRVERAVEAVRGEHIVHNELRVRSPTSVARARPVE